MAARLLPGDRRPGGRRLRVSIIIATFGGEEWSRAAWETAYPSTLDQAGKYEVVVHHEPTGTLAEARNNAAHRATGDWLCFLDADDELEPGYLQAMRDVYLRYANHWSEPGPLILAPAARYGSKAHAAIPNKGRWPDLNECVIGTLLPYPLFEIVGGFRELPSIEDYDLWLRCVKAGARIVHVEQAVYRIAVRPGSRNSDQSVYHQLRREHAEVWGGR